MPLEMHARADTFDNRCRKCGTKDIVALRDEHRDGKTFTVYLCRRSSFCGTETRVDLFPEEVSA